MLTSFFKFFLFVCFLKWDSGLHIKHWRTLSRPRPNEATGGHCKQYQGRMVDGRPMSVNVLFLRLYTGYAGIVWDCLFVFQAAQSAQCDCVCVCVLAATRESSYVWSMFTHCYRWLRQCCSVLLTVFECWFQKTVLRLCASLTLRHLFQLMRISSQLSLAL